MEIELWHVVVSMAMQTAILARVNRVQIESMWQHVNDAKKTAGDAHRRIDGLLRHQKS